MSGNYFSKKENEANHGIKSLDDNRSSCMSHYVVNRVLKYCLVIVYPVFIYRR